MNVREGWQPAIVMGSHKSYRFFMCIEDGISAVLQDGQDIRIGDYYEIKIAENSRAEESYRAKHLVIQYNLIEPLVPTYVVNDSNGNMLPFLTATAKFDGYITHKGKRLKRFFNEKIGMIFDLENIVQRTDQLVEFELRCRKSPASETQSIFVAVRVIGYHELPLEEYDRNPPSMQRSYSPRRSPSPPRTRRIAGFVGSKPQDGGYHFVWAKEVERDVILEEKYCPQYANMLAKWVEMEVSSDGRRVVGEVKIIDPLHETRVYSGVPEVFVTFEFDGIATSESNGFPKPVKMFWHKEFGFICDMNNVIEHAEKGDVYCGWIVRQKTEFKDCKWKISPKQASPERVRSTAAVQRAPSPARSHTSRSSSRMVKEEFQFGQYDPRMAGSSPNKSVNGSMRSWHSDKLENNETAYRSRSPSSGPPSDCEDISSSSGPRGLSMRPPMGSPADVEPAVRRLRNVDLSDMDQVDEMMSSVATNSIAGTPSSRQTDEETPTRVNSIAPFDSFTRYATPPENPDESSGDSLAFENKKLKLTNRRVANLVKFFLKDPEVSKVMKNCDLERHDELKELMRH